MKTKGDDMNHLKAKLISVLAISFVSLALVTTAGAMHQDPQQPAHNPQHQTQNPPQAQPAPSPHPTPNPTPHPIAQPTVSPGLQPSPHLPPHSDRNSSPSPNQNSPISRTESRLGVATSPAFIGTARIKVNARPAIQFVPFDLSELQTRTHSALSSDSSLMLRNGTTMPVNQYLEEINKYEQAFNKLGYTLRGEPRIIALQELEPETDLLPVTNTKHAPSQTVRMSTATETTTESFDVVRNDATREQVIAGLLPAQPYDPPPSVFDTPQGIIRDPKLDTWGMGAPKNPVKPPPPWTPPPPEAKVVGKPRPLENLRWGIPGFRLNIEGGITNWCNTETASVRENTMVYARVFDQRIDLLRLNSSMVSYRNRNPTTLITMTVGGNGPINFPLGISDKEVRLSFAELSKTFYFSIGPIPASATISIGGDAGIKNYRAEQFPLYAKAQYVPFIGATATVSGGPDIGIVRFEAVGKLDLLKEEITISSECGLRTKPNGEAFLTQASFANGAVKTLGGSFGFRACVDLLLGDVCFEQTFSTWDGYTLDDSRILPLQWEVKSVKSNRPPRTTISQ
jgi:hypothetical protein